MAWGKQSFGMQTSDIESHAHQIYKSTRINRLTPPEWLNTFEEMSFKVNQLNIIGSCDVSNICEGKYTEKISKNLNSMTACTGYRLVASK